MTDKKIIVIALVLGAIVIGGGWYYTKNKPQEAAVLPQNSTTPTPLVKVTEQGISYGNPDAPVVMEEYTNFLCPACANFANNTFGKINTDYISTGKVRFEFFVYPPFELSRAALCAAEQNKFIEYHEYTFAHQSQITDESIIKDFAVNAGLDSTTFSACYDSGKYGDKVQKWLDEGQTRGVEATPTFFINGQKLVGAQPYEEFQKIIDGKLSQ